MRNLQSALSLAAPYWTSPDRSMGVVLLVAVLFLNIGLVAIAVLLTYWQRAFFNALEAKDWEGFLGLLFTWDMTPDGFMPGFGPILAVFVACTVYALYLKQALQIRWRKWMTEHQLNVWLGGRNYYLNSLGIGASDNIDQRISEDIDLFVEGALTLGFGLITAVLSLISFIILLWTLSEPITILGITIHGYLVWLALLYAGTGTLLTHFLGRRLISLNFERQRLEADFRYGLIQVRDNAEDIALLGGEQSERGQLSSAFERIKVNWLKLMNVTKRVTLFTSIYNQAALVFPLAISAPAYFAGRIPLGGVFQTAGAFVKVQEALSWFVDNYAQIAEWLSAVARLDGYVRGQVVASAFQSDILRGDSDGFAVSDLKIGLPDGRELLAVDDMTVRDGERVLIEGSSGAGKSTFLRILGGIWPFGTGLVSTPLGRTLVLPQRAYVPQGSLRRALAYPRDASAVSEAECTEALAKVGLAELIPDLETSQAWNTRLSGGELQRLALAGALIYRPDCLVLDEATANLDEAWERRFFEILASDLPKTTIISVSHRPAVRDYHDRILTVDDGKLVPKGQVS